MTAGSRTTTAAELLLLPRGVARHELVKGTLRSMSPSGHLHGKVAARFAARLTLFVDAHGLGETYAAETGFLIARNPDTVRAPDVAFVAAATLAARSPADQGFFPGSPDFAVEVISPSDSDSEIEDKITGWLEAGCRVVAVLDPRRKTATLHRPGADVRSLGAGDELTVPELLPGWSLSLREVFR